MKVPLEDFFPDIIGKAQRGLHLDDASLAQRARLERDQIERLKTGSGDRSQVSAIEAGVDADQLFKQVRAEKLTINAIFITHTHQDHVAGLTDIISQCRAPVFAPATEPVAHSQQVREGFKHKLGSLEIEARLTNGHSAGGTSYLVSGLAKPVVVVGDSLFAGSMGGAPNAYEQARKNNREKILSIPPETIICPGHGPMTTVANERVHNPFFAER